LTNEAIKDSESYKEYYTIASGPEPPKTKESVKKKHVGSDKIKTPLTAKGKRLKTSVKAAKAAKKKQPAKTPKAKGLTVLFEKSSKEEDDDEVGKNDDDDYNDDDDDDDDADNQDDDGQEDDDSDEEIQGVDIEEEEMDEENTNEEEEVDELYRDVNVNLEGRDTKMTDALRTIIQTTQSSSVSSGFVSNMFNPSPDTGIDSIFNLNTESTSRVDVTVTTIVETPLLSATTLPPPPIPLILHPQQTPIPIPAIVPSSSLQDLPNFGSLFGFEHRLKTLETDFLKFKQTNQFATSVSSIPGIVDAYLANKMHEAVKTAKTVNEQLKAEVLTRLTNESKTSHAIVANLSELELKNILIDKMESNKSIHISDEQKNLYKALVHAYESNKLILDMYGDTVSFKRRQDDEDKDEEPSARSNWGSKRRRAGKELESSQRTTANLSELELKKILIDKMESNKSIHRSDEQKNLYKALVDAYESDKLILDMYGDTVLFKRRRDDEDKDEEPSAGSN
ncbi:hypothetical protein Tco_0324673, partial [Tanacetum coccineum]